MQNIRPVSDLRNNWNEVDTILTNTREPIIFTKNGYRKYVLFDTETYKQHQIDTEIYSAIHYKYKISLLPSSNTIESTSG